MHRHANLEATATTFAPAVLGIGPDDRSLSVAKLFFAYGLGNSLTFPFSVGASAILEPDRPTPAGMAALLEAERPTLFFATPGFIAALLDADLPVDTFSSVRLTISAGEALPGRAAPALHGTLRPPGGRRHRLHRGVAHVHLEPRRPRTSRARPAPPCRATRPSCSTTPTRRSPHPTQPGYLHVKGPSTATGYWCRRDATHAAFRGEWLRTGDVYTRSDDGYYTFLGRNNDMIKAGGIWVSPAEVEGVLVEHPDVLEAAVVGAARRPRPRDDRRLRRRPQRATTSTLTPSTTTAATEWPRSSGPDGSSPSTSSRRPPPARSAGSRSEISWRERADRRTKVRVPLTATRPGGDGDTVPSSYASGTSDVPLLGRTIGEDLARTVARLPDGEALVDVPTGRRWTYRELDGEVDRVARALLAAGHRQGRPGRHLVAELRRVGVRPVRHAPGSAPSSSTSTRRTAATSSSTCCSQAGIRMLVAAPSFKTIGLRGDDRGGARPTCPALEAVVLLGTPVVGRVRRAAAAVPARDARGSRGDARLRRPDQHPVHVGHDRVPEGRDAVAPQHPQQRLLRRPPARLHGAGPGVRAGALLPLLRDGDGQPRGDVERVDDRDPGAGVRPGGDAAGGAGRAVHLALRRAHDVHRRARPPGLRRLRPRLAAHRDHGRRAVPDRGHEAGRRRDAHGRGHDHVRHDRDVAGLDDDAPRATTSSGGCARSAPSCPTSR